MRIRITVGDWGGNYEAATGRGAIKLFFGDVAAGKIKLCQLSPLGIWNDGRESIPFRIAPALFKMGLMSADDLVSTFQNAGLEFEPAEIIFMVNEDSWMVAK